MIVVVGDGWGGGQTTILCRAMPVVKQVKMQSQQNGDSYPKISHLKNIIQRNFQIFFFKITPLIPRDFIRLKLRSDCMAQMVERKLYIWMLHSQHFCDEKLKISDFWTNLGPIIVIRYISVR